MSSGTCIVCEKPTTSHRVLDQHVCHTCFTEHEEQALLEIGSIPHRESVAPQDQTTCHSCGSENSLRAVAQSSPSVVSIGRGMSELDTWSDALLVICPACQGETIWAITRETADELERVLHGSVIVAAVDSPPLGTERLHLQAD